MEILSTRREVETFRQESGNIGFVPTMGALHPGHLSLINKALQDSTTVICSIYVNPTQFNNADDLKNYPRPLSKDLELLSQSGCHAVFLPETGEIYIQGEAMKEFDFGKLTQSMEGMYRPGHFNGMANVVNRLFNIVQPAKTYFGEKDFQQMKIVMAMIKQSGLPVELVPCKIIREKDGLAMSSRNVNLSQAEREAAASLFKILKWTHENMHRYTVSELISEALSRLNTNPLIKPEYLDIRLEEDLSPVMELKPFQKSRVFLAAYVGKTRLIDNYPLYT